jgi:hypothetical protein
MNSFSQEKKKWIKETQDWADLTDYTEAEDDEPTILGTLVGAAVLMISATLVAIGIWGMVT